MKRSHRNALLALVAIVAGYVGLLAWENKNAPDGVRSARSLRWDVSGRWDWTTREYPCTDSAHVIAFPTDSTMTITSAYPIVDDSSGEDLTVATYDIVGETSTRITGAIRGETRRTESGAPVVWDLIVSGPDSYAWHRTDWSPLRRTAPIRRCTPQLVARSKTRKQQAAATDTVEPYVLDVHLEDFYRGVMVNNQLPDDEIPLRLSVFGRTDSSITGHLEAGEPLVMKGLAYVGDATGDSMYLIVETPLDTFVLASATKSGSLGGDYWVSSGRNIGQGGTWELSPARRVSATTLTGLSATLGTAAILGLLLVVSARSDRWWSWRDRQAHLSGPGPTFERIGGWLTLFLVGVLVATAVRALSVYRLPGEFRESWMLGDAIPVLHAMLVAEGAFDFFYVVASIIGVVLLFRRSTATPLYFSALLSLLCLYGLGDIGGAYLLREQFVDAFGEDAARSFDAETAESLQGNRRLVLWSLLWMLYWMRSRRVASLFGASRRVDGHRDLPAVSTSYSLPAPEGTEVRQ